MADARKTGRQRGGNVDDGAKSLIQGAKLKGHSQYQKDEDEKEKRRKMLAAQNARADATQANIDSTRRGGMSSAPPKKDEPPKNPTPEKKRKSLADRLFGK